MFTSRRGRFLSIWRGSVRHHYRGQVKGNVMGGMVNLDGREAKWQAERAK